MLEANAQLAQSAVRRKTLRIAHAVPIKSGNSNAPSVVVWWWGNGGSRRHVSLASWISGSMKGRMAVAWRVQAPLKHEIQARGPLLSSLRYTM